MSDQITLTKEDLSKIISDAVAKALTTDDRVLDSRTVFQLVSVKSSEIRALNEKYPISSRYNRLYGPSGWTYNARSAHSVYAGRIHNSIRYLVLALHGVSLNTKLNPKDYQAAISEYQQIKDLFLKLYEERLDRDLGHAEEEASDEPARH
ncbi:MAG: hypothetical protein LKJ69_01665 [Lactobacillus sp.]|jgi:hypothetical protein|nr:hypothetical protein [Lactobacillus sp.]MCI2032091.1 hypothetical protein [Lactobacillus sp.]